MITTYQGKEYTELPVRAGYYPFQIAKDYLGNANLYPQIIRKSTGLNLTADSSRQLKAGEILLVPTKKSNPVPNVNPSPSPYPLPPNDNPDVENKSNTLLYLMGAAGILFFLARKKKGRR